LEMGEEARERSDLASLYFLKCGARSAKVLHLGHWIRILRVASRARSIPDGELKTTSGSSDVSEILFQLRLLVSDMQASVAGGPRMEIIFVRGRRFEAPIRAGLESPGYHPRWEPPGSREMPRRMR